MSKRIYTITSAMTFSIMTGMTAVAQTSAPNQNQHLLKIEPKREFLESQSLVSGSIVDSETAGGNGPSAQLSFTTEGSSASFKLASGGDGADCEINTNDVASCRTANWDLTFAAPFDSKSDALLDLATLDGLASGVNATFKYSFGRTGGVDVRASLSENARKGFLLANARRACAKDADRKPEEKAKCRRTTLLTAHSRDGKFPEEADHLISAYFPDALQGRDTVFKSAYSYFVNFEGKVNYEDFDFIDPTDLSSESTEKFEYSAGISATYVTLGERQLGFTTGVKFQSDFKQADEGINCLNDMGEISCVSGRPLAPERKESLLGFSEFRYIFDDVPGFGKMGIAPRLTHDFDEDVTGINLPVFLASGEGNLSSGFQVGWRSDTDEIVAGFFIGTQLNLFQARD